MVGFGGSPGARASRGRPRGSPRPGLLGSCGSADAGARRAPGAEKLDGPAQGRSGPRREARGSPVVAAAAAPGGRRETGLREPTAVQAARTTNPDQSGRSTKVARSRGVAVLRKTCPQVPTPGRRPAPPDARALHVERAGGPMPGREVAPEAWVFGAATEVRGQAGHRARSSGQAGRGPAAPRSRGWERVRPGPRGAPVAADRRRALELSGEPWSWIGARARPPARAHANSPGSPPVQSPGGRPRGHTLGPRIPSRGSGSPPGGQRGRDPSGAAGAATAGDRTTGARWPGRGGSR